MTEKVKKGNEKSEFPLKRNFSKNSLEKVFNNL